ncbi:MAG: efflux RND transporter periplasmic adaptor subunit [Thermoanaerobaculia bacterium]|nr:efflux RND transporter periplasmic adaptor subunit [Thermoanaerobaculia bacterium]MBP9824867.1 efflux RND transporter periplasmic adaptor subunit [Thermoanaerobaculia bacterium]
MKRGLLIAGGVVVLAGILLASLLSGRKQAGEKVYVETASRRELTQSVKSSGQIQPRIKVNISAHVIGKIEKLYAVEGAAIAAGAPFLELEREAFLAARDNARAQLAMSKTAEQQAIVSAADEVVRLARAEQLSTQGIASVEALEAARLRRTSADLSVEQAREAVTQARAMLVKAEDDLRKTTIYAPLSGRVIALNAEVGEVVVSGTMNNPASVIGTIADLSEILAEIDVDETEVVHLATGQRVILKVDAIPDREYTGRVVEIGSSGYAKPTQPDVTFFQAKVLFDAPDDSLRPGMSARAEIEVSTHADALAVPIQSVVERKPGDGDTKGPARKAPPVSVVFVVEDGKAKSVPVKSGISDSTDVEIVSGLAGGEQVITGPYRALRKLEDGDAVRVTTPELEKNESKKDSSDSDDSGTDDKEESD